MRNINKCNVGVLDEFLEEQEEIQVLANFFLYLRKLKGLNQAQLAKASNMVQGTISKVENAQFNKLEMSHLRLLSYYGIYVNSEKQLKSTKQYRIYIYIKNRK